MENRWKLIQEGTMQKPAMYEIERKIVGEKKTAIFKIDHKRRELQNVRIIEKEAKRRSEWRIDGK